MKSIACYALHYGLEYLPWSIRSIQDAVDEIHVFYAEHPSYGHGRGLECPEHELELQTAAHAFLHRPLFWHKGEWSGEGAHRHAFIEKARAIGASLILIVDSDELWVPGAAEKSLKYVYDRNCAGRWMFNFQNFWRSFNYEVRDWFEPIRIVDLRHSIERDERMGEDQPELIYHYGYAQSLAIMKYKWSCHGHQSELKPNWFEEKFIPWTPATNGTHGMLHPTSNQLWDRAFEVSDHVKENNRILLHDHPYFSMELIS